MKNIVSALVGTTALTASLAFAAPTMEAQAAVIGSIDIVGKSVFSPTAISFSRETVLGGDGVFTGLDGLAVDVASLSRPTIAPLSSPLVNGLPSVSFSVGTQLAGVDMSPFAFGRYAGTWTVEGKSYKGFLSLTAQQEGPASSFSISGTAVPEPLTLMGAGLAVALGAAFKKQASKSQS